MITPDVYEITVVSEDGEITETEIVQAHSILTAYRIARTMIIGNGKVSVGVLQEGDLRKTLFPIFGKRNDESQ